MCWGDVTLDFLDADERPLTAVTLHHGSSIRRWPQDALLADGVRRKILAHARDPESRRWLQHRITGLQ
ncbi:hypothetical protein ACFROC_04180 [Nocardia tengchongensis]|uniref:hypothetical protein n=1 Tax=Nocardia tengchongensis TaxID=2055889 RepID=UPI0036B0B27F